MQYSIQGHNMLNTEHMLRYAYFPSQYTHHNYLPRIYIESLA